MIRDEVKKIFSAWSCEPEIDCVVVANTKNEALGVLLEKFLDTIGDNWTLEEIDPTVTKIYY